MLEDNAFKILVGAIFLIGGYCLDVYGFYYDKTPFCILGLALLGWGIIFTFWGLLSEIF